MSRAYPNTWHISKQLLLALSLVADLKIVSCKRFWDPFISHGTISMQSQRIECYKGKELKRISTTVM